MDFWLTQFGIFDFPPVLFQSMLNSRAGALLFSSAGSILTLFVLSFLAYRSIKSLNVTLEALS